ncbi:MAG: hypothetical protein M9952_14760 [Microthrixaceae bacterium]|nr:hypothetical protein [Microthrixaceae bacterium]MCO5314184.1 hypothetical protein [Microthrixaceae bacterium]
MALQYLSDDWLDEAAALLARIVIEPPIDGPALALDTIVTGDDSDDSAGDGSAGDTVRFRYLFDGASVTLIREIPGEDADISVVRITQSRRVAIDIARGERSAQEAFLATDIQLGGDVTRLIQLAGLLDQVGDALAPLRATTEFR